MATNSKIEWTDHTFNPWIGCTKVSPGCDHCYAEIAAQRFNMAEWGIGKPRKLTSESNWNQPLKWERQAEKEGRRYRVFCASLADVFDNEVPQAWRNRLWDLIQSTPNLDWLLLTKRIGNVKKMVPFTWPHEFKNVWLGISVVNQTEADRDIPKLLATPARVRFLSMEPLLGPVRLPFQGDHCDLCGGTGMLARWPKGRCHECGGRGSITICGPKQRDGYRNLNWVIVGGESGKNARPMHPDWVRGLRDQCNASGVPFFFKQWGEWRAPKMGEDFNTAYGLAGKPPAFLVDKEEGTVHCFYPKNNLSPKEESARYAPMVKASKKSSGRLLDGREWDEFPTLGLGVAA